MERGTALAVGLLVAVPYAVGAVALADPFAAPERASRPADATPGEAAASPWPGSRPTGTR